MKPRLETSQAFYLLVSIAVGFLAASSAPTPVYAIYQAQWGFSPITTTLVFGVYAFAVLASLLTFGSLSDHVGRRPVLLVAILLQATAMLLFATAGGVPALMVARIVQGLSTGAAVGAVGAALLDLDRAKGTIANAVGPMTGTALGGITSGLMVQYLPAPTRLVYLVLLAVFIVQAVGVLLMPESSPSKPGALASLRPQFRLPPAVRRPMLLSAPVLIAAWALAGFYASLGPTLVRRLVGSGSFALGGVALFVLAASGAVTVLALHGRAQRTLLVLGTAALLAGGALTLLAIAHASLITFLLGTAVAGAGFGAGFQGAIRTILPLAALHERAGVLSIIFIVSYVAFGLPAVLAGIVVAQTGDVIGTASGYGVGVMALSAIALLGTLTPSRDNLSRSPRPA